MNVNQSAWPLWSLVLFVFMSCGVKRELCYSTDKSHHVIRIRSLERITDYSQAITQAMALAQTSKVDTILFEAGQYKVSTPIVPFPGVMIKGIKRDKVIIEQMTWGHPAFDVYNVANVSISEMTIVSTQPREYPNGFVFRGTDGFVNNAGIYSNSEYGTFTHLDISGFTCGLFLSPWNGVGLYEQKKDNVVEDVKVDKVDFGVLATGQKNFSINHLSGTYQQQQGSGAAPHLIYISASNDPDQVWTEDFSITNCYAIDGIGGQAYQLGTARNGTMTNLNTLRCSGILAVKNFINVVIDTLVVLEDRTNEVGSVFIQPLNVEHITMKNVRIESLNPVARILRLDGNYNAYSNISVMTAIDHISDQALITMEGEHSTLSGVTILTLSDKVGGTGVRLQGKYLVLENITCNACRAGFAITTDSRDCKVVFESSRIAAPKNCKECAFFYNQSTSSTITDQSGQ